MVKVQLFGGLVRDAADGAESVEVEAKNIRQLLQNVGSQYPKLKEMVEDRQLSVSIDGNIFRDNWQQPIPSSAEICILPRIAGG